MSENKTFFRELSWRKLTLREIFSDVFRKHTSQEIAQVFIAGTPLTTPLEEDMLSGWQKPFLFARFFLYTLLFLLISFCFIYFTDLGGYFVILGLWVLVPVSLLLLVWEMNIPRNISLYELIRVVAFGGLLSCVYTVFFSFITGDYEAILAPLTEEPAKLLFIYLLVRKNNYRFTLNGILIGMAVGTGFAIFEDFTYIMNAYFSQATLSAGLFGGIYLAFIRAITGIAGHGLYAALYGGALVMVKQEQSLALKHIFSPRFLMYFAISFGLHMLNNSGIFDYVFYSEFYNICLSAIVTSVIGIIAFLPLLRKGVNEIVAYVVALNNGNLTFAVNRNGYNNAYHKPQSLPKQILIRFTVGSEKGHNYRSSVDNIITIGRSDKCNLKVEGNASVSKQHCKIHTDNGKLLITDLNSTNGTFVGSQRLSANKPFVVANGSIISLGKTCSFQLNLE